MIDWIDVANSSRIVAMAYDVTEETIYVRFPGAGVEWQYLGCPPHIWDEFSAPGTSKGAYINATLNAHQNGRYLG